MALTCSQMDVLISFYIDGDLSSALKFQVEEHLKSCTTCRAKYDIIKSMIFEMKKSINQNEKKIINHSNTTSTQYRLFKNNLSAYIDNELPSEENIKMKKYTINNLNARQELEDNYNIRKILNESFKKTKSEARQDFSKNVLRKLELEDETNLGIHPLIKMLIFFTLAVLIISSLVLMVLRV